MGQNVWDEIFGKVNRFIALHERGKHINVTNGENTFFSPNTYMSNFFKL